MKSCTTYVRNKISMLKHFCQCFCYLFVFINDVIVSAIIFGNISSFIYLF